MSKPPIGIGFVGVGTLAQRVLPHFCPDRTQPSVADRAVLTALCDVNSARAQSAAREFNVPAAYSDLDHLLADPAVDAVSIASPIGMHYEQGMAALRAGKHVHFNKTMTTTVAEADALIALAAERDLRIVASPGEILHPRLARTRELLREGAIGHVTWFMCGDTGWHVHETAEDRVNPAAGAAIDPTWYFRKPGGGPMYDITVYSLHQLTSVLGPAQRVTALSGVRIKDREFMGRQIPIEADDNSILLLDFGNALFGVAYGSAAGNPVSEWGAVAYYGTGGTLEGGMLNGEPFDFPGSQILAGKSPTDWGYQQWLLPDIVGGHRDLPEPHVFQDIMQLVDWVRDGKSSPVTAEHARHVIDIIESGYRSAETGMVQVLTTTFELPGV